LTDELNVESTVLKSLLKK